MPAFEGLRVEVQKLGAHLHAPGFEEYESSKCVARGSGVSLHRLLRLPTEVQLQILVCADMTFQWEEANALRIQIDFDKCHEVKDAEIFVMRPVRPGPMNAPSLISTLNGDEYTQLSQIARPIQPFTRDLDSGQVEIVDAEMVSFKTIRAQSTASSPASLHGDGVIRVAVYTCLLEHSGRQQASLGGIGVEKLRKERASAKLPLLCNSKIELFDRVQQSSVPRNYRSKKAKLVGSFIFHYRAPEDFDKLKGSDEEGNCIEDAGPGKRRVVPYPLEPTKPSSSDRATSSRQNPEPVTTSKRPRPRSVLQNPPFVQDEDTTLELHQDRVSDQEEDTIVVLTNGGKFDTMDVDVAVSPASNDDSVTDPQTDADFMDIYGEVECLDDLNYNRGVTAKELEFVIDREDELRAEAAENQLRMQNEYCEAIERIHRIRGEEVRIQAELLEKLESAEVDWREKLNSIKTKVKHTREEVENLKEGDECLKEEVTKTEASRKACKERTEKRKADLVELEQEVAEDQELERQVQEKYDELVKDAAAKRPQREDQKRVLKKLEEKKLLRLSAVPGRESESTVDRPI